MKMYRKRKEKRSPKDFKFVYLILIIPNFLTYFTKKSHPINFDFFFFFWTFLLIFLNIFFVNFLLLLSIYFKSLSQPQFPQQYFKLNPNPTLLRSFN